MSWKRSLGFGCATAAIVIGLHAGVAALRSSRNERRADLLLREDPFLAAIVADMPSLREPIRKIVVRTIDAGQAAHLTDFVLATMTPLMPRYVSRASDAAVVAMARSLVAELKERKARDPEDCYRALFPEVAGPVRLRLPGNRDGGSAIRQIVATARAPGAQARPGNAAALARVHAALRAQYGAQVEVLARPQAPDVDRQLVCSVTTDLYDGIVQLPEADAAGALRQMFETAAR
jgi:hypothetical protein